MRHLFSSVTYIFLTFAAWTAMGSSLLADTATLRVLFGTAGVVVGVGNGKGTLTFHGKTYPFEVTGASFGATLTQTLSELEGRALNLRAPEDLAGNYISLGAGEAWREERAARDCAMRKGLPWWFAAPNWVWGSRSIWLVSP
jgi:hypothetical protein